jgi:hypothetical protein
MKHDLSHRPRTIPVLNINITLWRHQRVMPCNPKIVSLIPDSGPGSWIYIPKTFLGISLLVNGSPVISGIKYEFQQIKKKMYFYFCAHCRQQGNLADVHVRLE